MKEGWFNKDVCRYKMDPKKWCPKTPERLQDLLDGEKFESTTDLLNSLKQYADNECSSNKIDKIEIKIRINAERYDDKYEGSFSLKNRKDTEFNTFVLIIYNINGELKTCSMWSNIDTQQVQQVQQGGKPKRYIVLKGQKRRLLVHKSPESKLYVKSSGNIVYLKDIRGKYNNAI